MGIVYRAVPYLLQNFLNDYGLIWVGDGETSDPSETGGSFHMNFDLVLQRIRELNVLAGEGESFVQTTATGAKLAKKEPVQLRLYSNGVVMFDGPFRSYQEDSTQVSFLKLRGETVWTQTGNFKVVKSLFPLVLAAVYRGLNGRLFPI